MISRSRSSSGGGGGGGDFLQKYSCVIDCGCKMLSIPSKHISMQFLGSTAAPTREVDLVTVEKRLAPPKSKTEIMVSVVAQSAEGGTWMVEGRGRSGVMVAHAIVRPLSSHPIAYNSILHGEEAVMVKKGVTIASMEQLKEAKNHNMCDMKTRSIIAKPVLGMGYGHEGWKKH